MLDLDAQGNPQPPPDVQDENGKLKPQTNKFGGQLYRVREVGKLEVSGLILLYDENGFLIRVEPPIISEGPLADRVTLFEALMTLATRLANNDPEMSGVVSYKVSRYKIDAKFAVDYFDTLWRPDAVRRHLEYYAEKFEARETVNRVRNKPARINPTPPPSHPPITSSSAATNSPPVNHPRRRGNKKPRNPNRYHGMPPGFRLRLNRYLRELTASEINAHNQSGTCQILRLEPNGDKGPVSSSQPDWYLRECVYKLQVSGLILLYDEHGYLMKTERVINEGPRGQRVTLHERLLQLAGRPPEGVRYYKVARYKVDPKFAVSYFETLWRRNAVDGHLAYFEKQFQKKEQWNKGRGKPAWVRQSASGLPGPPP